MYSLRLTCKPEEIDFLSADLYEAGTIGIRELDEDDRVTLIACFETNEHRAELLTQFSTYSPHWYAEDAIDWAAVSRDAWPAREVGQRLFLAPPWSKAPTPRGRYRIVHNPGLACGTGEHPCTQLALLALEGCVRPGCTVVDIGTGPGILAIAALHLGATRSIGLDIDCAGLLSARENFDLNALTPQLICGSADSLADASSDVTVANISATVLLSIWDDFLRITRRPGCLIVTGFPKAESQRISDLLPGAKLFELEGWSCLAGRFL